MREKNYLYKKLLEKAPYGTLFFAYGVCIDANPKALSILKCDRSNLVGMSLFEETETTSVAVEQLRKVIHKIGDENLGGILWKSADALDDQELLVARDAIDESDSSFSLMLYPLPALAQMVVEEFDTQELSTIETAKTSESVATDHEELKVANATLADEDAFAPVTRAFEKARKPINLVDEALAQDLKFPIAPQVAKECDTVAGLPASRQMIASIASYLELYREDNACGALLLIDLDHFSSVSQSLGKHVGTQIIEKASGTIQGMLTDKMQMDLVAGDAFLLFIRDIAKSAAEARDIALSIAHEIRRIISRPFYAESGEVIVTASVGICLLHERTTTAEQAIQKAESAMFEAKRRGRDAVVMFDSQITRQAQQRINLQSSLRKAVANQEFDLYLQPQVSIQTGHVIGGEVLLRWLHPGHALHTPAEFIPVLESSGMIVDVGQWVIRTSCEYLRNMLDRRLWNPDMHLGINISPRQFHDPNLLRSLEHSMKSYDINPQMLTLEVTENLLIDDFEYVIEKMKKIRDMGPRFSIDDFGSGYSSMIYLKRLPLDSLKIDREFIRNIHADKDTLGLVEAIMMVSRHYGLDVIAEGVEKRSSLDVLHDLGCDKYQGAVFSMPVPVERFEQLLAA